MDRFESLVRDLAACTHPHPALRIQRPPSGHVEYERYCPRCGSLQVKGQWLYPSIVAASKSLVRAMQDTIPAPVDPGYPRVIHPHGRDNTHRPMALEPSTCVCGHARPCPWEA